MRRSMLFLPGNTPNMIINGDALGADSIILDLEDAVSPDEKDSARLLVRSAMKNMGFAGCEITVRINSIDTDYWKDDLEAVIPLKPDLIMPPKASCAEDMRIIDEYIAGIERRCGMEVGTVKLIPLIETALGVENAFNIASACPRVAALFLGGEDLTADLRCKRTKESREIFYARTRLVMAARAAGLTVKRFDLILADSGSFILVVMLSDSSVKNKLIRLPVELTEADLKLLGAVLNASVTELTAEQLSPELLSRVTRSAGNAASLVPVIMDFVTSLLHQEHSEVYMTGQAKLLGQPEYHDIDKAQKMLSALDEDVVSNLPAALSPDSRTQILVGPENVSKELRDTSVVMTKFDIGDGMQGLIGVVGPTRMDYAQITARLSYFAENLSRMFQKNQTPAIEGPENKHNDPEA